jgi:ABC-2 type transport system permease protein
MLFKIAAFELRYQLRSPLFFIGFALFFLLAFGAMTVDGIQIGDRGNTHLNSPANILQIVSLMNVFGLFVITAFVANVVIRDDETGFAPIIRATQITKFDYLVGRFSGALLVAILVMASVPLAMMLGAAMPSQDAEEIGPFVASHYLYAFFVISVPTLLAAGAGFFALATATRSMMWTYVGLMATLVLFIVSRVLLREPEYDAIGALSDPFGLASVQQATKYWTAAERNSQLPVLEGLLLHNRLIWSAAGALLFAVAYGLFRFEQRAGRAARKQPALPIEDSQPQISLASHSARSFGAASSWRQFVTLVRFECAFVLKSPAFFVLLALGVLNSFGVLVGTVENQNTEYLPVTRAIVGGLTGAFFLFQMIIAVYYAGELVWRDRDRHIHEIIGASAAPSWTFLIPKVIAIALVLFGCLVTCSGVAILFQLYHGYTQVDVPAYLLWFVLPNLIDATLLAVLAVFVQTLVPHKFFGWAVMLLHVVAQVALASAGFEHNLYNYGGAPGVPLSDMNDMGRFWVGRTWFHAYWLALAVMLLVLAHLLWRRGADTQLRQRLARLPAQLKSVSGAVLAASVAAWIGLGAFIYYNTNVLNDYRTAEDDDERLADFEKELLAFETVPQPRVTDVKLSVDLYPKQVRAYTQGEYTLQNRTEAPVPVLHVLWLEPLQIQTLEIAAARLEKEYPRFNYRIYRLDTPMQPGETRVIRFTTVLEERGFTNRRGLTRIVGNGTFVDNTAIAPVIGMSRAFLLKDRAKRREYGLPADLRPAALEDTDAVRTHYLRKDSDWVNAELRVSTDADQTPVAPGYTVSDTVSGDRRTLITRTDAPIMHFFSIQSARYAVSNDAWTSSDGKTVNLAVYYHPEHAANVRRMLDAMKVSLDIFSSRFSPFQFQQARILEFPAYAAFAQSFANTVPYSESIGFIQNYHEERAAETIDLVSYVTAHEIAHQWWGHQLVGADKQGMTLLSESFAQYSALLVMEQMHGREQIRKFLKGELDQYLRNRGTEVVEELPLARVENQGYIHYQKGALAMYWLREVVGEEVVNRVLQKLLAQFAFKPAPYASSMDFLKLLRAEAGPQHDALITDLFEKITLYDMKASKATAKRLADGKYQVTFLVTGRKLYADGEGAETEAPLAESFDVGAFLAEPGKKGYTSKAALLLDRQPMHSGEQQVTFTVEQLPKFVGVDPYNKRIDRNSDDNLTRVTVN